MKSFFITGLPRSRSAWLANLFTTDQTLCWHDKPFSESLLENPRRVGFAGPELVKQFSDITKLLPEAPWIVVLRDQAEALASFKHWAGDLLPQDDIVLKFWKERCHVLSMICPHSNVQTVNYSELDLEPVCRDIWRWLLPDIGFDSERWKLLNGLNVQQDINKNLHRWQLAQ